MNSVHPSKVADAQKRLLRDVLTYRGFIVAIIFISVLSGLVILVQMYSLSLLIDGAFLQEWNIQIYLPWIWVLFAAIAARSLLVWYGGWLGMQMSVQIKSVFRKKLIRKLHELGPVWLRKAKPGELISLQITGIEKLDDFFGQYVPAAIRAATIPIVIFAVVLWVDWPTGLVFLITGPLIPVFMYLIGTKAGDKIREQWKSLRRMNAHFLDTIQGMDTLKLFGREKVAVRNINHVSRVFRITTMRVLKVAFLSGMILELVASISTAVVAVEVGVRLIEGMITFQTGMFVLLLAPEFYLPFRRFGSAHHAGMEGAEAGAQLYDILDQKGVHTTAFIQKMDLPEPPYTIQLNNVSYTYPNSSEQAVKSLNLHLMPGKIHAITGESGAGKTTLIQLISGLLKPDYGSITVNEVPLEQLNQQQWRNRIAIVSQFPHLFSGILSDNITMGKANVSMEEIGEAVQRSLCEEFTEKLPAKLDTYLGENGLNLSGGERQRVALARAFFKKAPILFLDEPAASLNSELELCLMKSLREYVPGRIILMVSHRPNSILASDKLSILKNGSIIETGSPDILLKNDIQYLNSADGGFV